MTENTTAYNKTIQWFFDYPEKEFGLNELVKKLNISKTTANKIIKKTISLNTETKRSLGVLDNFRRTRHNINYYGYQPSIAEVKDRVDFTNKCFSQIYEKVKEIIN